MKILTVDIGNTHVKCGVFQNQELVLCERFPTLKDNPTELKKLIREKIDSFSGIEGMTYSSVVPQVEDVVRETFQQNFPLPLGIYKATPDNTSPVDISQYAPNQIGADRWTNLCAAHYLYPKQDTLIIDFGTATTFNLLSKEGQFLGGAITPGLMTFANILGSTTSKLHGIALERPKSILGKNTQECLEGGIVFGYLGVIQTIVKQIMEETKISKWLVIATGGLAQTFNQLSLNVPPFDVVDPKLTLKGLQSLFTHHFLPSQKKESQPL